MVKLGDPIGPLANAQALAAQGLQVLPARFRDKAPIVKWRDYQSKRTDSMLPTWFGGGSPRNFWVMTGRISGVVVVDCDSAEGDKWWRDRVGDEVMDSAVKVRTAKGTHYWFRLPDGYDKPIPSWSVHVEEGGVSFDFRADDTGVIAPPSVHETGHQYAWDRPLGQAATAPAEMLDGTLRALAPAASSQGSGVTVTGKGGVTRSMLTSLLAKPPGGEGSGRNDWLARVAGHYAKTYHNALDLYEAHCLAANQMMGQPLAKDEFDKTIQSVWRGEHDRNPSRALDATCGWLQSSGTIMLTQVMIKSADGESKDYDLAEYADFDLQAKGVMVDEDGERTYWVNINRKRRGVGDVETIDATMPGRVLGDDRALRKWLAGFACTILPPNNMWPREGTPGVRIQRYLEAQHPPIVKITKTLGWDQEILDGSGGFVTHEGVITADTIYECEEVGVRPEPTLKKGGMAPHVYGYEGDAEEARRVLEEVLTFHDETITSVFGAWWAACLLKPQIEERTALFPFVAIEAPSESGKTNGYFDMMTQLNGNTRGETVPTYAALRDMAASHRNGIVWVDDLDDPSHLMELLRAATAGGTLAKMSEDRESVKNKTIVSPIVLSGEALGIGSQKALLDRAIILKVGSPTGRMSRHDPSMPQWDDVLALREQYPEGLSAVAGWLVQDALGVEPEVLALLKSLRVGTGRAGDKVAILRAGARLLDWLVSPEGPERIAAWGGDGPHAQRVDAWVAAPSAAQGTQENALTLELIPWALRKFNYPDKARAGEKSYDTDMPVFVKDWSGSVQQRVMQILAGELTMDGGLEIWFNSAMLAEAWEREKHGRVERRTHTESALKDQANALNAPAKRFKIVGGGGRLAYYRRIDGDLAYTILARAQGQ